MDNKAQSALEYLLLIAGVVLVAAIVIIVLINSVTTPTHAQGRYDEAYGNLEQNT